MATDGTEFLRCNEALLQWAHELAPSLHGGHRCFAVRKLGAEVILPDCVLVKVLILEAASLSITATGPANVGDMPETRSRKAAVRMTHQQFETLGRHVNEFRILQASIHFEDPFYVLDVTNRPAFMAGYIPLQTGEALRVAELLSGGFMGWSRAGFALRDFGVPWHTTWYLDADCTCAEPLRYLEPDITVVSSAVQLAALPTDSSPVFLAADFCSDWWQNIAALRPTHLACVSPPCQPWSRAGRQSGLATQDGRLLIQVTQFLGAAQVAVVLVEEVAGLASHPHFGAVLQAWRQQGYRLAWRRSLQLAEVCPTSRLRLFLVFVHETTCPHAAAEVVDCTWRSMNFPSLEASKVLFRQLPHDLLQPCLPSRELRDIYLDERFFPPARANHVGPRRHNVRVRTANDQAGCFLASYHSQHELPVDLLESKGILCSLLSDAGTLRFLAAPEVACAHAVNLVHFMPADDKDCMRWLGNSLAVPQSAFVAALALQFFQPHLSAPDPREVVAKVLADKLDCTNAVFVKVDGGCLLRKRTHLATLLARKPVKQQVFHAQGTFQVKRQEIAFSTSEGQHHALIVLGQLTVSQMPPFFDSHTVETVLQASPEATAVLQDSVDIDLSLAGHSTRQTASTEVISLLAPRYTFCANIRHPETFLNLSAAFTQLLLENKGVLTCTTVYGDQLTALEELPSLVLLHQTPAVELLPVLVLSASEVAAVTCICTGLPMVFAVPAFVAEAWWLSFPAPCLSLLGITTTWEHFPVPETEHAVLTLEKGIGPYRLPEDELQGWMRSQLVLALLRHDEQLAREQGTDLLRVEVQIDALTVWQGHLPDEFAPQDLLSRWTLAAEVMQLSPTARVYTGPFPIAPDVSLARGRANNLFRRRASSGALLLSLQPEIRGGGTKDEVVRAVKVQLGHLCLGNGCGLNEVSSAIGQLVSKTGLPRLQALLRIASPDEQWRELQGLCHAQGVLLPTADHAAQAAAKKIQAAARRKKLFQRNHQATDFNLISGFITDPHDQPAPIIQGVMPGAKGVALLDFEQARQTLQDVAEQAFELPGILVLGVQCPCSKSCQGRLSFPAFSKSGEGQVLLSGCFGRVALKPALKSAPEVAVAETLHCTFQLHCDDWPDPGQWAAIVKNPVRHTAQVFKASGHEQPLAQPWARSFRVQGGLVRHGAI